MRIPLILEVSGLTEEQLQKELTCFFEKLQVYEGFGATVSGLTEKGYQDIKRIIDEETK